MEYLTGPLLAFLGISALVIMTPGPDTAITIRNTLTGGRAGGVATALGVATGQAIWALATSAGIVALLVASEPLFLAVKYAGAAYLVWLGLQSLRAALRPATGRSAIATARPLTPGSAFSQGLVSDLSNPKMAAFFTSLLPQFVPPDTASFAGLILLGLLFSLLTLFWLVFYTLAIARVGNVLRRLAIRRALEGITGAALIGLGLKLATEDR
ncbi:MAG TPA: LysE family translocator [Reyranella sp.]|jgi:RhtB (resistance to homoserine/threonine) family protein|nr:LysE family translocator [Reyranella sp.]